MKAYIIRHAEKEYGGHFNPQLRHQDEPLTPKGLRDAEKLRDFFAGQSIAALYVSGYLRARQTIGPTARALGLTPIVDERLNEIDNGLIEGLSEEEVRARYPDVWHGFTARSADFRFPEGESGEDVRRRIMGFLEAQRRGRPEETIIAVAHDGLIRLMMCAILGLPVYDRWNFHVDFCGITEISGPANSDRWKLIRFNQTLI